MDLSTLEVFESIVRTAMWVYLGIIASVCFLLILRSRVLPSIFRLPQRPKRPSVEEQKLKLNAPRRQRVLNYFWHQG